MLLLAHTQKQSTDSSHSTRRRRIELIDLPFYNDVIVINLAKLNTTTAHKLKLLDGLSKDFKTVLYIDEKNISSELKMRHFESMDQALFEASLLMKKYRSDGGKNVTDPKSLNYILSLVPENEYHISLTFQQSIINAKSIALVNIEGNYPPGSEGSLDGKLLRVKLNYFFQLIRPDVLIVDMTRLNYTWGDDWDYAPLEIQTTPSFPYRLIISEEQEKHMRSLMGSESRVSRSLEEAYDILLLT